MGQSEPEDAMAGQADDKKAVKRSKFVMHAVNKVMKEETEAPKQTPHTASKRNLNVERDIMEIMSQGRDVRQEARIEEAKRAGILKEEKAGK